MRASRWIWDDENNEFIRYDLKDTEDEPEVVAWINVPRRKPYKRVLWCINRIIPDEVLQKPGRLVSRTAAPTVEAAKKTIDEQLRAQGWELEDEG